MLAQHRELRLGEYTLRTPLLIPSFSSKGFPNLKKLIEFSSEYITDATLVSLYDYHYSHFSKREITFSEWLFLDSGGYEASKDSELSELHYLEHEPLEWTETRYRASIKKWKTFDRPSVIVTYDHPKERLRYLDQVARAERLLPRSDRYLRNFLLKPETEGQIQVQLKPVLENPIHLAAFDIIGLTEKELGNSLSSRLKNLALLRRAMQDAGLEKPIHVFGSLDTVSTPLYFLAGADIFDGLTWLRFSFMDGMTAYKSNFGAVKLALGTTDRQLMPHVVANNVICMQELQSEMQRYLNDRNFTSFSFHQGLFEKALEGLRAHFRGEAI